MRRPPVAQAAFALLAMLVALSPDVASACPAARWCGPPSGAPTSAMAELKSAHECDKEAANGEANLMMPSGWLRLSRVAGDFRDVNDARDYAAEYRVRATRARSLAARLRRMRVTRPSELA